MDDIKYMIDLATKEIAHHRAETAKWEQTLARLQKTQQNYTAHSTAQSKHIQSLELELQKTKTTGPAAVATSNQVNTAFNTPMTRPAFSSRPSLIGLQKEHNHQQLASSQQHPAQGQQKPKLIAKVLYAYPGMAENNVMSLTPDEFLILHSTEGDWYLCQRTHNKIDGYGPQQFAPRNYLQLIDEDVEDMPPSAPKNSGVTVRPAQYSTLTRAAVNNINHAQQTTISTSTPVLISPSHSTTATTSTPVAAATGRGPPPFRGSVGPSAAPVAVTATTPTFGGGAGGAAGAGSGKRGPPPFGGAQHHPPPPPKPVVSNNAPKCTALFDFTSNDKTLLSFSRGDVFTLEGDNTSSQWWLVVDSKGVKAYVPSNYVKMMD